MADYDLIVIGGGGAGLSAAATAAAAGCSVLVLEAEERFGGSTSLADGVFNAAGTTVQAALGLEDTIDNYFHYYMTLNAWRQPAALIRSFCESATETLEWLISLGIEFPAEIVEKVKGATYPCSAGQPGLYASGVEWPPRGHTPVGFGAAYTNTLYQYAGSRGAELVPNTRVERLLIDGNRVAGVIVDGELVKARGVLLACGGIAHNADLLREWFPDTFQSFPEGYVPDTISAPGSRGDAIGLGRQAGAQISGRNCGLLGTMAYVSNTDTRGFPGFQPTSLIYVNRDGKRFADETAPYAVMPGLIKREGGLVWGIFDEGARLRADPSASGYAQGWDPDFVLEAVSTGDMRTGGTLDELALAIGVDAPSLREAVQQYNEDLATGIDRTFLRPLEGLHPIAAGPFYAFEYRPCNVNLTGVGVQINHEGKALDVTGAVIPGLYAAGESGAGVLGERYVGGGNSIANALTMGRVVGRTFARDIGKDRLLDPSKVGSECDRTT